MRPETESEWESIMELEYIRIAVEMLGRQLTAGEIEFLSEIDSLCGKSNGIAMESGHLKSRQTIATALALYAVVNPGKRKCPVCGRMIGTTGAARKLRKHVPPHERPVGRSGWCAGSERAPDAN